LETALAGRTVFPQVWLPLALVLGSIIVFGRYFCAWVCPAALLDSVLHLNSNKSFGALPMGKTRIEHEGHLDSGSADKRSKATPWIFWLGVLDSRYLVLVSTLLSAAAFGFPIFCLICPVGLFFGALFAIGRLFSIQQPSLELVLFPALLGLELFAIKSWCRSICPLGALLSLTSGLNRFFRPVIKQDQCLASRGVNCQVCRNVCPQQINLQSQPGTLSLMNCTKCLECSDRCPVKAIEFPLRAQ
jgi:ferredoxin-type protein NapH